MPYCIGWAGAGIGGCMPIGAIMTGCGDISTVSPSIDAPRVLVTVLVAQHRGLAGRVGARGVAGVLTPRQQVAI